MTIKILPRFLATAFAVMLMATACSSDAGTSSIALGESDSAASANSDSDSAADVSSVTGVIYFSTSNGELQTLNPVTGDLGMLWDPALQDGRDFAIEVSAADRSTGVHVLTAGAERLLDTELKQMVNGQLQPVDGSDSIRGAVCVDSHANAATTVAHFVTPSLDNTQGTTFVQTVLGSDSEPAIELTRSSSTCPRYNSSRTVVMTSTLTTPGDVTTESVVIDGPEGSHQISIDGCGLTPRTFSPDDKWALVAVACYFDSWNLSGLYAIPTTGLMSVATLSEMTRIGDGIYGRTAWHPAGGWLVANRYESEPEQTPSRSLQDERANLVLISTTGSVDTYPILGQGSAHSVLWASESFHTAS